MTGRKGARWTHEADAELRRRVASREPVTVIAREMGRTQDAIRGRAAMLRIALPSTMRPWRETVKRGPRMPRSIPQPTGEE